MRSIPTRYVEHPRDRTHVCNISLSTTLTFTNVTSEVLKILHSHFRPTDRPNRLYTHRMLHVFLIYHLYIVRLQEEKNKDKVTHFTAVPSSSATQHLRRKLLPPLALVLTHAAFFVCVTLSSVGLSLYLRP